MKLSEVDTNSLDNELIKMIFFNIKKGKYNYADYIIVYGCHIKELLDERLNYALDVLNNHKFDKVILTGGIGANGNFNESEYMKNYLMHHSIDESKIIIENKSKTTEENNINIMDLLNLKSIDKPTNIVLITQEIHLLRIILHWSKILKNDNIHFYYDYVENSILSYDKIINNPKLVDLVKAQIEKTKRFINEEKYVDIDIRYRVNKGSDNMNGNNRQNTTINWYPGHMAKTKRLILENINLIDVVYEVVDARIPYSSVVQEIDDLLKNKPRILIMTKSDLCDKKETNKWIENYKNEGKKVLLLDLEHNFDSKSIINLTEEIMEDINAKRISKGLSKRRTRALIVGIPNVGKSTLINRLVGKKAVNVGNVPGITKELNWIRINEKIELLDTPGILWPKLDQNKIAYNLASLTAIKEEILPLFDVVSYILETLNNYYPEILKERYGLDSITDGIVDTLDIIGKKRGCLIKGGEIDYEKVYNVILNDIKNGYIKGITFDRYDEYKG